MTETLPRLLTLQACDQRIQQATHTLDTLQQSLATLREEEQASAQNIHALRNKSREAEQTRDALTLQLDQVKAQLRDKKHGLHRHRTEQPDEPLQREVALLEAHKATLEEELCTVVAQITHDTAALRQAEEMVPTRQEETQRAASTLLSQIATTEEELHMAQDERATLATGINALLLQDYERIFSRRGGVAVVALANATCQGCYMHVPPQMCLELQRSPRLTFCPHCHRILFASREASLPVMESPSPADNVNGHCTRQPQRRPRTRTRTSKKLLEAESPPASPAQA
jgi:hypothetical protein